MSWRVMNEWGVVNYVLGSRAVQLLPNDLLEVHLRQHGLFDAADYFREIGNGASHDPHGFGGEDLPEVEAEESIWSDLVVAGYKVRLYE